MHAILNLSYILIEIGFNGIYNEYLNNAMTYVGIQALNGVTMIIMQHLRVYTRFLHDNEHKE